MRQAKQVQPTDPAIAAALAEIRSRNWPRQHKAIQALAAIRSPECNIVLLRLLDHRSSAVREAALGALAERESALARLAARALLADRTSYVRSRAADVLAAVGTRLDIERLTRTVEDDDEWVVRATAANSLGLVARKSARPALIVALRNDPSPIVRRDAAFALSYAGDTSVIPEIESALATETEEQARLGLLNGLYALGERCRLPELLRMLQSEDGNVRHAAFNGIADSVQDADYDTVIAALKTLVDAEENPGTRIDAEKAIASLSRHQLD